MVTRNYGCGTFVLDGFKDAPMFFGWCCDWCRGWEFKVSVFVFHGLCFLILAMENCYPLFKFMKACLVILSYFFGFQGIYNPIAIIDLALRVVPIALDVDYILHDTNQPWFLGCKKGIWYLVQSSQICSSLICCIVFWSDLLVQGITWAVVIFKI